MSLTLLSGGPHWHTHYAADRVADSVPTSPAWHSLCALGQTTGTVTSPSSATHTHTNARACVRAHTHTHARTHARTHAHTHTRTHTRTHMCTHTHACCAQTHSN